jgi:fumarate reductase flavoprotein subunit
MEMVQFHPTGLIAGPHTRITGTIIEEGLRGAGGHLLNGHRERFMHLYDPRNERATRDIVSRGMYDQMRQGNVTEKGGLYISMAHLDPAMVRTMFKGMVERCADCGFDLVSGLVDIVPTAHYMMGGVVFATDCTTELPGLFAAGEDSGGVHGANRLGGNGVANSTVFGGIAGDTIPTWLAANRGYRNPDRNAIEDAIDRCRAPLGKRPGRVPALREKLYDVMWDDVGIIRDAAGLARAERALDEIEAELDETGVADANLAFNLTWHDWLNMKNLLLVSKTIRFAAMAREDSRGAHFRSDFPDVRDLDNSRYTCVTWHESRLECTTRPVAFTRVKPGESLLAEAAAL